MTDCYFLARDRFDDLIQQIITGGYQCIGPQIRDGAVVYDELSAATQLPVDVSVDQQPGEYRTAHASTGRYFGWSNGPQALKPLTFQSKQLLWQANKNENGALSFNASIPEPQPQAVIGVRSCDLAALALQDQHFLNHLHDPYYSALRQALFIVAVNCSHPAATCFCASTGDGPTVTTHYDLLLDELDDGFILRCGSENGKNIALTLPLSIASEKQIQQASVAAERATINQHRQLPEGNLSPALFSRLEHPHWDEIAKRCLSCGNCTSVCPTCFCHSETEESQLDGSSSSHYREWDSCFTEGHSYIHGIIIRADTSSRYRQWLTHKLGSWHEQYGRSGCTGCGRCITWCPVGIDLTEEVHAFIDD